MTTWMHRTNHIGTRNWPSNVPSWLAVSFAPSRCRLGIMERCGRCARITNIRSRVSFFSPGRWIGFPKTTHVKPGSRPSQGSHSSGRYFLPSYPLPLSSFEQSIFFFWKNHQSGPALCPPTTWPIVGSTNSGLKNTRALIKKANGGC